MGLWPPRAWLVLVKGRRSRPSCPQCRDDRLVEWDRVLQKFVCDVCSYQWRPEITAVPRRPRDGAR